MVNVATPILLIVGFSSLLAVWLVVLTIRASRWFARALFAVGALVFCVPVVWLFLAFHEELVDARVRTYKAFYSDVRVGMTRDELLALLKRDYAEGGPRQRPKVVEDTATRLSFCMSPEAERDPNCEGIYITFIDGRVSQKEYVRD
jgi:hypothetical protein